MTLCSTASFSFPYMTHAASVISFSPNNVSFVEVHADIIMSFSETITIASGTVDLYKNTTQNKEQSITIASGTATSSLTLSPSQNLDEDTEYYILYNITLDTGENITLTNTGAWEFATNAIPTIQNLSPVNGQTGIDVKNPKFTLTFSEDIRQKTGNIYIKKTSNDSTFRKINIGSSDEVTLSSNTFSFTIVYDDDDDEFDTHLEYNTSYYINIDGTSIDDLGGNSFAGISSEYDWYFKTEVDAINPDIEELKPDDGDKDISIHPTLIIEFEEDINEGEGYISIYQEDEDELIQKIDVSSSKVQGSGTRFISIRPTVTLAHNTDYYVLIDAGGFVDISGNSFEGIDSSSEWEFRTIGSNQKFVASNNNSSSSTTTKVQSKTLKANVHFLDIENHWAKPYITSLTETEVFANTTRFFPDEKILRLEVVKVVLEAFDHDIAFSSESVFTDIDPNIWYHNYIATAVDLGIVSGTQGGSFAPHRNVSRVEALKMIIHASGVPLDLKTTQQFSDIDAGSWHASYVNFAVKHGIVQGRSDSLFEPDSSVTRAEIAKMVYLMKEYAEKTTKPLR